MSSPIGALMIEAEKKAAKKANGHTEQAADCTCEVEVNFLTKVSTRIRTSRCAEHQLVRESPAAKKRRRAEVED